MRFVLLFVSSARDTAALANSLASVGSGLQVVNLYCVEGIIPRVLLGAVTGTKAALVGLDACRFAVVDQRLEGRIPAEKLVRELAAAGIPCVGIATDAQARAAMLAAGCQTVLLHAELGINHSSLRALVGRHLKAA